MIYKKLIDTLKSNNLGSALKIALIDPDKKNHKFLHRQIDYINNNNFTAVFCGGSIMMDSKYHDRIDFLKKHIELPFIGFPGSVSQINENFDAILFMCLVSGRNPQYLIGEQVLSSPIIYDFNLESIPIGYIILNNGRKSTVELISGTDGLPMSNHDIVVSHALASQYLGHKMIYLESGSDSDTIMDLRLLRTIKDIIDIPIIVGGGIKNDKDIDMLARNGADFIVVGTMIESVSNF